MNRGGARDSGGWRRTSPSGDQFHRPDGHVGDGRLPFDESCGSEVTTSRGRGRDSPSLGDNSRNYMHKCIYVRKNSLPDIKNGPSHKGLQQGKEFHEGKKGIVGSTRLERLSALHVEHSQDRLSSPVWSGLKDMDNEGSFKSRGASSKNPKDAMRSPVDLAVKFEDSVVLDESTVSSKFCDKDETDLRSRAIFGGLENSVPRQSMNPFDIFLQKNGTPTVMLKPSLLAQNREKRKAMKPSTEGQTAIVLRSGMVLLKNFLSINDQVKIARICRQLGLGLGGFYQPGYSDGSVLHLRMMCLGKNWNPETGQYGDSRPEDCAMPPMIPDEFNWLVAKAIRDSQAVVARNSKHSNSNDELPWMSPNICIVNFYSSTGRLGLHQDKDESEESLRKGLPVVSFSIGDSAEFLYGDQRDVETADKVILESGDVLLFGGKARRVFHGVRCILPNTAPKALLNETNLKTGRLNLTFRQF